MRVLSQTNIYDDVRSFNLTIFTVFTKEMYERTNFSLFEALFHDVLWLVGIKNRGLFFLFFTDEHNIIIFKKVLRNFLKKFS